MRRVATSWWDHAQFPSSPPPGAFPDSLYDHLNNHSPSYVDLPPPHHPPAFVDSPPWMYPPVTPATTTELSPPMDALTEMVTALDESAAATAMSVTEEALRNYMVEQEEEERRRRAQQQEVEQLASYAQLQLFSPSHRQEFLQHYHPFALYPPPTGPILSPHARSSFAVYHPYPPAFVPVVTTRSKPPAKRKRMTSPKKKKSLPEKKEATSTTGETEDSASTNRLKPILLDDDAATTHSSKCESKPAPPDATAAAPPTTRIISPPKQRRTTAAKSRVVVDNLAGGTVEPASALRALAKHEVAKAVQFIAIPPPLTQPPPTQPPSVQLVPPTPTPTQPNPVPILPRGRVISPWTDDVPEENREDLWQLLREDDIWSVASSSGRRDEEATDWNDDPEMVSLLCDALDV